MIPLKLVPSDSSSKELCSHIFRQTLPVWKPPFPHFSPVSEVEVCTDIRTKERRPSPPPLNALNVNFFFFFRGRCGSHTHKCSWAHHMGRCVCVCVCVCIDVFLALFNMGGNHLLYMSCRNRCLDETKIISVRWISVRFCDLRTIQLSNP